MTVTKEYFSWKRIRFREHMFDVGCDSHRELISRTYVRGYVDCIGGENSGKRGRCLWCKRGYREGEKVHIGEGEKTSD